MNETHMSSPRRVISFTLHTSYRRIARGSDWATNVAARVAGWRRATPVGPLVARIAG
jgi:hypothetical protein